MKKTITFPSLNRCWLPVLLAFFYSLTMNAQDCNLVCNDHVNASIPADTCYREFVYQDFLQNPTPACTSYQVQLSYPYGTDVLAGYDVNRSHIGYTFVYSILDIGTNGQVRNSCWGYVTIEDKAAPQPLCKNTKVSCFQVARLTEIVGEVIDNCGQNGAAAIEELKWEDWGCTDERGVGRVSRSIRTWDEWGNTSTCRDTLTIGRDSLSNVKAPETVQLSCRVWCKKPGNSGDNNTRSNFDLFEFSPVLGNANYPTPEKLLDLQLRDTFGGGKKCIPANIKVVPYIRDQVLVIQGDTCILVDSCVAMWPVKPGFCKTSLTWKDQIIPVCGTGFKVRREWLIADWCTGQDTVFVQYIKIEDKEKPEVTAGGREIYERFTGAHDCVATVDLKKLTISDCDPETKQEFIVTYPTGGHSGAVAVVSGTLPKTITLPGLTLNPGGYAEHKVKISISDRCLNRSYDSVYVRVYDITPPTPVCDEHTQTTVDPATCWARVYARDLDNGSRDNCCNVLHFAVAHMDTLDKYRKLWVDYWNANCKADYWNNKVLYDKFLEEYLNVFVFDDYIDLSDCGKNLVVLRVYEACGVPRYDSHVYPCGNHSWYTYNSFLLGRLWHNFQYFHANGTDNCVDGPKPQCLNLGGSSYKYIRFFPKANDETSRIKSAKYVGAETYVKSCVFEDETQLQAQNKSGAGNAPGNSCSIRQYNDCMINIWVDDKSLPVCVDPKDKVAYCDGVIGEQYEYAKTACHDYSYTTDNFTDKTWKDGSYNPYKEIECVKENDGTLTDANDPTGKFFGWYGGNIYAPSHGGDHDPIEQCQTNDWSPIYCHTWLCLDKTDQAGKFDAYTLFDEPVAFAGNPGSTTPGAGKFYIWDNCAKPTIEKKDEAIVDKCGNGWIKRTWTAKDKCENTIVCDQKIILRHRSDFEVEFPADTVLNCEGGNTDPDKIGRPIIMDDECELVGVNYEDVRYDIIPDACYKIVRTWKLIDWCKYDPNAHGRNPEVIVDDRKVADIDDRYCVYRHLKDEGDGYITYTQIIKVVDEKAPVLNISDTVICVITGTDANCTVPGLNIPLKATDNCTPANAISFRWELDANASSADITAKRYNAASIDARKGNVTSFTSSTVTDGTHLLTVIAEDNCGNEDTTTIVITVKDCKKPTPYCFNGIATVLMPTSGEVQVWASDLNAGSYDNCTAKGSLTFHFDDKGTQLGKTFTCADIPNGIEQLVTVDVWVTDLAGNKDFCRTYILIQDGVGNICADKASSAASIAGIITTETKEAVEKVTLNIKSAVNMAPYQTDNKGGYAFKNLPLAQDYTITPKRDDDPMNGVSTIDLVLIQKHILGSQSLGSPYKMIAADVDRNNDITALDLVELRKLILTIYDKLPNNTSWRFVPKSYDFTKVSNVLSADIPEYLNISQLSKEELEKDFIGVKIGDVNSSSAAHSLLGAEARESAGTLKFKIEDKVLKAGEETTVSFTSDNFSKVEGYQFSMQVTGLSIVDIKSGALKVDASNFGMGKLNQGYLTTSWSDGTNPASVSNGDALFTIKVKATKNTVLSEAIRINSRFTRAEAYANTANGTSLLNVGLEFSNSKSTPSSYALHQNTPNPFKGQTVISFDLPKSETVTLSISDVTGKMIRSYSIDGNKGANRMTLNRAELSAAGVLYYTLETKSFRDTKKMLLVD